MKADNEVVLAEDHDEIRIIRLNRPEVLNAFDASLGPALHRAVDEAGSDRTVRCVVITGAGRAFCSGQDLRELATSYASDEPIELGQRIRDVYNPVLTGIRALAKPVIASVNGVAAGAGCSLALAADLRIAGESASFIQAFINLGLVPDCGGTFMLPRLVGLARAMELAMTGRKVGAPEALQLGLVNQVVPDNQLPDETMILARKLASLPTQAIGLAKRAIHAAWTSDLETQLHLEAGLQAILVRTHDHREGLCAFVEKRPPKFIGR